MRILLTGSTGLIGARLITLLSPNHEITRLSLRHDKPSGGAVEGHDAVIHLAGESIAAGRWTAAKKQRIRDSRVNGTRILAEALAQCQRKPRVMICASAIGYYGNRGEEVLTEASPAGEGFLPGVCTQWEQAAEPARWAGIRVVSLRTGVVLAREGGALAKMLTPFKLGLGGVIASGNQYMSWIAIDDMVRIIQFALDNPDLAGPVNAVSPHPVTNRQFTKTLGRVLGRPTIFPMPAFAARLAFGEMADALLLSSARVLPSRLEASGAGTSGGFAFQYPNLEPALRHILP